MLRRKFSNKMANNVVDIDKYINKTKIPKYSSSDSMAEKG